MSEEKAKGRGEGDSALVEKDQRFAPLDGHVRRTVSINLLSAFTLLSY
jgi:hypothetical protein